MIPKGKARFISVSCATTAARPVADARVMLSAKGRDPLVIKTNVLGLFRSHISKEVQPDDVQLACEKQGYRQTEVLRRAPPGSKAMNIEINCTLQRL
jgi:hypothetical protein